MKRFLSITLLSLSFLIVSVDANAVFVTPQFVVFEKNNTARITLNNRSNKAKVITFEWQRRYFDDSQKVQVLEEGQAAPAGYQPVDGYVKFSPRRVILRPRESQTIRLIANRPQDMADGEYRTQFIIKEQDLVEKSSTAQGGKGVTAIISVNVNTGIPVFIRHGDTRVNMSINSIQTTNDGTGKSLKVDLQNDSTRTLYTDAYVSCSNKPDDTYVGSIRAMVERKNIFESFPLSGKNLEDCANPALKILGVRDREYGNKTVIEQGFSF